MSLKRISASRVQSIFFDYGTDSAEFDPHHFSINSRGMCFRSAWQFGLGTELSVSFQIHDAIDASQDSRIKAQGVVVHCERKFDGPSRYEVMVLFLDVEDPVVLDRAFDIAQVA